jgi:hypothetical protein
MRGAWSFRSVDLARRVDKLHTRCSADGARCNQLGSTTVPSPWRRRPLCARPRNCTHGAARSIGSASATARAGEEASAKHPCRSAGQLADRQPSRLLQGHAGRARARPRSSAVRYPYPACMFGPGSRCAAVPRAHGHPHYRFLISLSCVALAPSDSAQAMRSCARFPPGCRAAHASQARGYAGRQDG